VRDKYLFPVDATHVNASLDQQNRMAIGAVVWRNETFMPVFARRRLQAMLDDLAPVMLRSKASDILARLEHKNAKDALAAEVELGLLWSIQQVADLEIDPMLEDSTSRPDASSRKLFGSGPAVIEITAVSDDTFSNKNDMERAANIICQFCNGVRKGSGAHFYFQFLEKSFYEKGRFHRKRLITPDFALTSPLEDTLRNWLRASDWPSPGTLRLTDEQIDVIVQWKKYVHPQGRTFSSMPAVAYHAEDNPVFKALKRKERQLSGTPEGSLKCIFLGDAGCNMLRELKPFGVQEVSGDQAIRHFLSRSSVDVVGVFSPYRAFQVFMAAGSRSPQWKVSLYTRTAVPNEDDCALIHQMVTVMPRPQLEGYQARSWHQQGMFDPQGRGIYLGCNMTSKHGSLTIRISSRMVLELLAGRITQEQFQNFAFGKDLNQFDHQFKQGMTIQSASLEKGGLDEDDDYLVFDMEPDFGARPLRNPKS
jgi:hypothetical protein